MCTIFDAYLKKDYEKVIDVVKEALSYSPNKLSLYFFNCWATYHIGDIESCAEWIDKSKPLWQSSDEFYIDSIKMMNHFINSSPSKKIRFIERMYKKIENKYNVKTQLFILSIILSHYKEESNSKKYLCYSNKMLKLMDMI